MGFETLVNTTVMNNQIAPAVTALAGGGYIVVWDGYTTSDSQGEYYRKYDNSGENAGQVRYWQDR